MQRILFILFLPFLFVSLAHAVPLRDLVLKGATRTKESAIMSHGHFHLGEEMSPERVKEIRENLKRIDQVRIKNIDYQNGVLTIEIEEKWSLFPVPMITQSGDYYSRGGLIYENNFLGYLGTFATAVAYTNTGFNGLLYFQDETFFTPNYGFKILALRKSDLTKFKRSGKNELDFESVTDSIAFVPNFITPDSVYKIGPIYYKKKIFKSSKFIDKEDQGGGLMLRHHYNNYETLDVLYHGYVTTINSIVYLDKNKNPNHTTNADIQGCYLIGEDNFYNFEIHGLLTSRHELIYSNLIGGGPGLRGYDKASVPALANVGGLLQYQQHLGKRLFLSPFYELNFIRLADHVYTRRDLLENTFGLGIRYYFQKISIPAFNLDYSRNINDNSSHVLLNIGLSI